MSVDQSSKLETLPVAVDAMGADYGAQVVVDGAARAAIKYSIKSIIVGDEEIIRARLKKLRLDNDPRLVVQHAPEFINMSENPALAVRSKPGASICEAFRLVAAGQACAVVSPGNTGAMMAAGMHVLGNLPGIVRPAIATLLPRGAKLAPIVLLDSGANVDCRAEQLVQFALMGECYARLSGLSDRPRVALLSNGAEPSKGNDVTRAAAAVLSAAPELNFVGYMEGRDLASDKADVVVCDGFVGNVLLKGVEGTVKLVFDALRQVLSHTIFARFGMLLVKPALRKVFNEVLSPATYGGAPLLGLNGIAIVCHGSARGRSIKNAIRIARDLSSRDFSLELAQALGVLTDNNTAVDQRIWDRLGGEFNKKKFFNHKQ